MQKFSDIVDRAEDVRKRLGMNKSQFSGRFGMKPQTYNNFVGGQESKPNLELFHGIVREFGVDPGWLLSGVGQPFVSSPATPMEGQSGSPGTSEKVPLRFKHNASTVAALRKELDLVLSPYRSGSTPLLRVDSPSNAQVAHAVQVISHLFWANPVDTSAQVLAMLEGFCQISEEIEWLSSRARASNADG